MPNRWWDKVKALFNAGQPGHPFYGNQHTGGIPGAAIDNVVEAAAEPGGRLRVQYAQVTEAEAARIKAATGLNVTGYEHEIDTDSVRHIRESHPELTREDFQRIPEIVRAPDRVTKTRTKQNLDAITYEKRFGATTIYAPPARRSSLRAELQRAAHAPLRRLRRRHLAHGWNRGFRFVRWPQKRCCCL